MPETPAERLIQQMVDIDVALAALREWLPEHGFKLVMPPSTNGMAYAFGSAWRHGEVRAVSHRGTTPAIALLRTAEAELVKRWHASGTAMCTRCHGLGWFVANSGTVEICGDSRI